MLHQIDTYNFTQICTIARSKLALHAEAEKEYRRQCDLHAKDRDVIHVIWISPRGHVEDSWSNE